MPYRLLSGRHQSNLMTAKRALPIVTFLMGVTVSLIIGLAFHDFEIKSRITETRSSAKEYSKKIELFMLNGTLRIQAILGALGPGSENFEQQSQALRETFLHTAFQRMSVYKREKSLDGNGSSVYRRTYLTQEPDTGLPEPKLNYLVSESIRKQIKWMIEHSEQSAIVIDHAEELDAVLMIWKINPNEFALISAPIQAVFKDPPKNISLVVHAVDRSNGNQMTVEWGKDGVARVTEEPKSVFQTKLFSQGLLVDDVGIGLSSISISWFANIDRSIGIMSWLVWISGFSISVLFSLLFRFVLDQNRKVAALVVNRTLDLEMALDEATEANLAKTRFLANVSHELRTPLNLILGLLEIVEGKTTDSKLLEYIRSIQTAGDHLYRMITDVLDLAQKNGDELQLKNITIKCPNFFEEIGHLIGPECRKKNLLFSVLIGSNVPRNFRGDPARLRQILINLLRNSTKYTLNGFVSLQVSIVSNSSDNLFRTFRFVVRDSGVGIPKAKQVKVFDRFMQLESSKLLGQGGVGLGLSIVKDLVMRMNGSIQVDSEVNLGSTFTVDIDFEVAADEVSWNSNFKGQLLSTKKVALVANYGRVSETVKFYLAMSDICVSEFTMDQLELEVSNGVFDGYTDIVLCEVRNLRLHDILRSKFKGNIVFLGNSKESRPGVGVKSLDDCPILPTPLWAALGVELTSKKRQPIESEPGSLTSPHKSRENLTILIADDDLGNQDLYSAYFQDLGWNLIFVDNGQVAFARYQESRPDLVVADLRMPIMDGFELTDQIRAFEASRSVESVPIVLVTADALSETQQLAKEHGVNVFLTKPIRRQKIVDTIVELTIDRS